MAENAAQFRVRPVSSYNPILIPPLTTRPFPPSRAKVVSALAAEQDLLGSSRMITTTQVTAPLLPVLTPVPGEGGTYGKIAAGVAARIGGNVSATFNAETTFAREGGNGLVVSGGIKMGL